MAQTPLLTQTQSNSQYEQSGGRENEKCIVEGSKSPRLRDVNIGQVLDEQGARCSEKKALVSRWQGINLMYQDLYRSGRDIAQSLLNHGVRPKDRVVVLSGNMIEYTQLFCAVGGIGAIFAIINPTFTVTEVIATIDFLGLFHPSFFVYRRLYILFKGESDLAEIKLQTRRLSLSRTELAIAITQAS